MPRALSPTSLLILTIVVGLIRPCLTCAQGASFQNNQCYTLWGLYGDPYGTAALSTCPLGTQSWGSDTFETTIDACFDCHPGHYGDHWWDLHRELTRSECKRCTRGTYQTGYRQTSCLTCSAGHYTGNTVRSACTPCGTGRYSSSGSDWCSCCPAGTASSATTATSSATCATCPATTYSPFCAATCSPCERGYYCPGNTNRIACPDGTAGLSTPLTDVGECTTCAIGEYAANAATACEQCPAGCLSLTKSERGPFWAVSRLHSLRMDCTE